MTGAMVATGTIFFPAAPLFLFMHGKDITIPKGHEITVYTNTDFDPAKARAAAAGSAGTGTPAAPRAPTVEAKAPVGAALTNADVLKLKDAGLGETLVIDKIKSAPANYRLDTDDIVELKRAGLSDAIIGAMIQAAKR